MTTDVPELKKLLADNLITIPAYWRVHRNSHQVVGPTSVISEKQLPYHLDVLVKAPIFEVELVRALENIPEPEYIWVYYEGVDRVFEILKGKPSPMLPEVEVFVMNYLQSVEDDILELAKRHISSQIYARAVTTETTADIRRLFEKFQPSEENWECYVYLAEHCHQESAEKFNILPFLAQMAVQYFMCLFADGYEATHIIKVLGKCLEHDMLEFPTQNWSTQKGQQFFHSLRMHLNEYQTKPGVLAVRKSGKVSRAKRSQKDSLKVICYLCEEKGHLCSRCPKRNKIRQQARKQILVDNIRYNR